MLYKEYFKYIEFIYYMKLFLFLLTVLPVNYDPCLHTHLILIV